MSRFYFSVLLLLLATTCIGQTVRITGLQCEYRTNPVIVDSKAPLFSWQLQSKKRGVLQAAYRLLLSDNLSSLKKNMGNVWDSRKVMSTNSVQVIYAGPALKPATKYYWKVQVWDNKNSLASSEVAGFGTALFGASDWAGAKWIGYEEMENSMRTVPGVANSQTKVKLGPTKLKERTVVPLFRKSFPVQKKVASAMMYITGLGHYELSMNGNKIGNSFLAPGWTHYDKTVLYNAYDVTASIRKGENAIGVIVGNGFHNINRERYIKLAIAYGYPKMICRLLIQFSDGTRQDITSDDTWKTKQSPITFTSLHGGEDYDARLEQNSWDNRGYDAGTWKNAELVSAPAGNLAAEMDYPVEVKDILQVKKVLRPKDSVYIFDFAQNLSGIVEIKVRGKKGQVVKLWPGELLHPTKLVNQNATGKPYYFSYTLKGEGIETWRPRFSYTGFRYVQVEGAVPDTSTMTSDFATIISLQSLHTSNTTPSNGDFECSNKLFNDINHLIKWSIKSNLQSVVTDCPHREKLGWLEQDYLMGNSINANFNVHRLYKKLVQDMMDAQTENGLVPNIAPEFVLFDGNAIDFRDSPEWGSACIILPWLIYKWYGDIKAMENAYPMMQKYFDYLQSRAKNNILPHGLGDWYDNGPNRPGFTQLTPVALPATAIYFYDATLLAAMAEKMGKVADAQMYNLKSGEIRKSFNDTFFNSKTNVYATGSQTSMAMPLALGLVDPANKKEILKNLLDSINASGKKLTAGDVGFHFLVKALHDNDASQLIYETHSRDDVPGYGYQLKKGATSLTESWAALEVVSNNHLMLGHIMQWFYEGLAGISQQPGSYGYKNIVIKPELVGDIRFAKANHQSPYGNISSSWTKSAGRFGLSTTIPCNTNALIYLPAGSSDKVYESGRLVTRTGAECNLIEFKEQRAVIKVGPGNYTFVVNSGH